MTTFITDPLREAFPVQLEILHFQNPIKLHVIAPSTRTVKLDKTQTWGMCVVKTELAATKITLKL